MASEWSTASVAECAANEPYSTQIGPFGEKIRAEMYTATGAPILRGTNVNTDERFHDDDFVFMHPEVAEREFSKFVCEADDVILCHKGTLGKIGIVPKNSRYKRYIMGNSMMKVRCDRQKLEPSFLYYWLTSHDGQDYLFSRVSQVGVPQIQRPLTTLREATIPLPPLYEQRAIAHILGTLDDKIELNRRMSETLEAMARALFKSWLVDFDPVCAKAKGRDPGLPKHLADLFPDRFVDSELGEIPEGWQVKPIGDLAEVVGGSTPKTERAEYWENGVHHWVTPKDLSGLSMPVLLETERKISDAGLARISSGLLPAGTVLLSSRAPIGYLAIAEIPVAVNQGFVAMKPRDEISNLFLLRWASEAHDEIVSHANGSTFLEISKSNFRPIRTVAPSKPTMEAFDRLSRPLYRKVVEQERGSRTLVALRDSLLPKLISGELRVEDVERFKAFP